MADRPKAKNAHPAADRPPLVVTNSLTLPGLGNYSDIYRLGQILPDWDQLATKVHGHDQAWKDLHYDHDAAERHVFLSCFAGQYDLC